jgi:hypothetical protein
MRLALVLLAVAALGACSIAREGTANFTGFTAGVTGAAAPSEAKASALPR